MTKAHQLGESPVPPKAQALRVRVTEDEVTIQSFDLYPGEPLTVGRSSLAHVRVEVPGLGIRYELLRHDGRSWMLMTRRVRGTLTVRSEESGYRDNSLVTTSEPKARVRLNEDAHGLVQLGDTSIHFQLVDAELARPKHMHPATRVGLIAHALTPAVLVASMLFGVALSQHIRPPSAAMGTENIHKISSQAKLTAYTGALKNQLRTATPPNRSVEPALELVPVGPPLPPRADAPAAEPDLGESPLTGLRERPSSPVQRGSQASPVKILPCLVPPCREAVGRPRPRPQPQPELRRRGCSRSSFFGVPLSPEELEEQIRDRERTRAAIAELTQSGRAE